MGRPDAVSGIQLGLQSFESPRFSNGGYEIIVPPPSKLELLTAAVLWDITLRSAESRGSD